MERGVSLTSAIGETPHATSFELTPVSVSSANPKARNGSHCAIVRCGNYARAHHDGRATHAHHATRFSATPAPINPRRLLIKAPTVRCAIHRQLSLCASLLQDSVAGPASRSMPHNSLCDHPLSDSRTLRPRQICLPKTVSPISTMVSFLRVPIS